ncbi:hypothetical protein OPQ81_011992 [Rhizoctonia solani]|nr:hypothetical protein OPQ81_011992 [Rhizoctonia solani]
MSMNPSMTSFRPYVRAGLRSDPEGNRAERTGPSVKIPMEFDQHGAELGKDARFWRAYVKEADEWDEELVNGWNK